MLKRLLHELDYSLSRTDTDVFPLAIQVLHQRLSGLGDVRLEAVQGSLDDLVPLSFKLLAKGFVFEPLIHGGLTDPRSFASFLDGWRYEQVGNNSYLPG